MIDRQEGRSRNQGISLTELMVVVAIMSVLVVAAIPSRNEATSKQRLRDSVDTLNQAFSYAREESIRTGNLHLVFVGRDAEGGALLDLDGNPVDILVLDEGRPGSTGQNCKIDAGEPTITRSFELGAGLGVTSAAATIGSDTGAGDMDTGSSFADADGNDASWVMFRPEGTPVSFDVDCNTGDIGTGGGGIYLTNGIRDMATVVTPLGASRVHLFQPDNAAWTK